MLYVSGSILYSFQVIMGSVQLLRKHCFPNPRTGWDMIFYFLGANTFSQNFARNSGSQTQQKAFIIAVILVLNMGFADLYFLIYISINASLDFSFSYFVQDLALFEHIVFFVSYNAPLPLFLPKIIHLFLK